MSGVATPAVRTLRLGTRRSALAMAQARWVASRLGGDGLTIELVEVSTLGDLTPEPLAEIGGTGVFASALRQALVAGDIDLAVHSLKDLPSQSSAAVVIAAVPERGDVREALVTRSHFGLHQLPTGCRIGTGSPRRAAQLRRLREGIEVVEIRGNVDTRLAMVSDGKLDGVVLAAAGLERLGRLEEVAELIDPDRMLPAPGQGALAVECRAGDEELITDLRNRLENRNARIEITAERSLLRTLEAGCTAPIGAHARVDGEQLTLTAEVVSPDGRQAIHLSRTAPVDGAERLGAEVASQLLATGAAGLIGENS